MYAVTYSTKHNLPMSNKASNWYEIFVTKLAKSILNNSQTLLKILKLNEDSPDLNFQRQQLFSERAVYSISTK